ncbi:putative proteasome subunit beta type-7 [Gossypium arboreum]|uniref:Putative proteasome subunit beta type-7 n=1 Tax=Gossypium arboreum TaxID=29729 RepID=A0A0B0PV96_GOSAR|nr:putative proteasome subunit beta type-7 [Gossypium arboreum]
MLFDTKTKRKSSTDQEDKNCGVLESIQDKIQICSKSSGNAFDSSKLVKRNQVLFFHGLHKSLPINFRSKGGR